MELSELKLQILKLFKVENIDDLGSSLQKCVEKNDVALYDGFCELVEDLNIDWLQRIYQYYAADREEKKQDLTPKSFAELLGNVVKGADSIIDMCAGTGALTIQCWSENKNKSFQLQEIDENIIPYLLFNMGVRNIECTIHHMDVLKNEIYKTYKIEKGSKYGIYQEAENEDSRNI